jgi:hypothetical protein
MPFRPYTLERSRGDRYALSALHNKRASLAYEIVQLERQLRHCREALVHVDPTLRLLDPSAEPESHSEQETAETDQAL